MYYRRPDRNPHEATDIEAICIFEIPLKKKKKDKKRIEKKS